MTKIGFSVVVILLFFSYAVPQSGGSYELKQTVTATGGAVSGGTFSMVFTAGQPFAATVTGASFVNNIGFWTPDAFAPTAATVSISGRVTTSANQGIRSVVLKLTDAAGREVTTRTTTFGFYSFSGVRTGETYLLTIKARRHVFNEPTRILTVTDDLTGIDFNAAEETTPQ